MEWSVDVSWLPDCDIDILLKLVVDGLSSEATDSPRKLGEPALAAGIDTPCSSYSCSSAHDARSSGAGGCAPVNAATTASFWSHVSRHLSRSCAVNRSMRVTLTSSAGLARIGLTAVPATSSACSLRATSSETTSTASFSNRSIGVRCSRNWLCAYWRAGAEIW